MEAGASGLLGASLETLACDELREIPGAARRAHRSSGSFGSVCTRLSVRQRCTHSCTCAPVLAKEHRRRNKSVDGTSFSLSRKLEKSQPVSHSQAGLSIETCQTKTTD